MSVERALEIIEWVTGKIWCLAIVLWVLGIAVEWFQRGMAHAPFLIWQDGTWGWLFMGVCGSIAAMDFLFRGIRA